jgi:hypothetical protein
MSLQAFLAKSEGTFRDHPVWANVPVEHQSQAMEVVQGFTIHVNASFPQLKNPSDVQGLEKYLMTKIYYKTFAQSELDKERDVALSQRMAALSFVQPHHLDIPQQYQEDNSSQLAIKELHKINNYKVCAGHRLCALGALQAYAMHLTLHHCTGSKRQACMCVELLSSDQQLATQRWHSRQ